MADITELLPVAVRHHQAGQLAEAERIYQRILHQDPNNADALHLLGVMAHQVGRHEVAVESIGRAIAIQPREAAYHNNLGEAHRTLGRLDEAVTDRIFNPQRALSYLSRCKPEQVPIAPKPACSHRKGLFGTCRMPRGFARDGGLLPWDLRRRKIVVDDGWCEGRIVQHRVQLLGIVQ
jgi:hypothetical protein